MAARKVIVFGPTGAVGSAAARTAASLGAEVTLAMRDTAKVIPGLDDEKEKNGAFERTQADLTNPDTSVSRTDPAAEMTIPASDISPSYANA